MANAGLFTSTSDEWATPQDFFDQLDHEFGFTLDPCATTSNAKCRRFFTRAEDGLSQPWSGVVFMNPPYGRVIGEWVHKAFAESRDGSTVVSLIPSRTDTAYWHRWVMRAAEIRFVRGRLKFGSGRGCAPFPSAIVVFLPGSQGPPAVTSLVRPQDRKKKAVSVCTDECAVILTTKR